jgi:hypothetical protein
VKLFHGKPAAPSNDFYNIKAENKKKDIEFNSDDDSQSSDYSILEYPEESTLLFDQRSDLEYSYLGYSQ